MHQHPHQSPITPASADVPAHDSSSPPATRPWLLRPEEAADLLAISRSTIYELLAQGHLPSLTIGRCRRIPVEALRAWLTDQLG